MTNIYIIGAGTIGSALAVFLQHQGKNAILVRASKPAPNPTTNIQVLLKDGRIIAGSIPTISLADAKKLDGLIIITVKSFANEDIAKELKPGTGSSPIVILQNGLGVEDPFINQGFEDIYRCVLFATSQFDQQGRVVFKPVMASPIGPVNSNTSAAHITDALQTQNFQFTPHENIQQIVWKKTIANCVFNSVCPLLNTDNGIFHRNADALAIAKTMIDECLNIATLEGIHLTREEVAENLLQISRASDGQFISTLQDINQGRPTEIDALNLAIARIAAAKNQNTPITKTLGELIKLRSNEKILS